MKTISTLRGEAWVKIIKIANELRAAGDEAGAAEVQAAATRLGNLKAPKKTNQ